MAGIRQSLNAASFVLLAAGVLCRCMLSFFPFGNRLKHPNPASGAIYVYNSHGSLVWVTAAQAKTGQLLFWGAVVALSAGFVLKVLATRTRL